MVRKARIQAALALGTKKEALDPNPMAQGLLELDAEIKMLSMQKGIVKTAVKKALVARRKYTKSKCFYLFNA